MSQFNYLNEINSLMSMDGPVTRRPLQRWAIKSGEATASNSSIQKNASFILNQSSNVSIQKLSISSSQSNTSVSISKTPNNNKKKTPSKTKSPGRNVSTPTPNKGSKTPQNSADRFIPSRSTSNFELCHYMLNQAKTSETENSPTDWSNNETNADNAANLRQALSDNLNLPQQQRLLQYTCKAPAAPEGYQNHLKVVYSQSKVPSCVKSTSRFIPLSPDRILDAPDIVDDYYLNLVDWSSSNILGVALGSAIYLWHAGSGSISQLLGVEPPEGDDIAVGPHITSLAWVQGGGSQLAVGTALGTTELWDTERQKRLRVMDSGPESSVGDGLPTMGGTGGRVGALSWNAHVLSSGCRTGHIVHHDVRQRQHRVATLQGHNQEICGLKWSPDGKYLASGGNDNLLNIWQAASGERHSLTQPFYSFNAHQAAVKGLAWCPWNAGLLASGAGTADRTIRLWNINNGTNINTVDTKSQVCSIVWSTTYRELISGHGYANNQLIIWKYPTLTRVAELVGHSARVLHLALSPDGTTILSAGADETLRLWKCFLPDPSKKTEKADVESAKSIFKQIIR